MSKFNVLDIFSGCGGLSYGFQQAGFHIVAGIDIWKDALITFKKNHQEVKTFELDLSKVEIEKLKKDINQTIDVIIGGPPCQGFSISGKRNPDDPRNYLYKSFVDSVKAFKPKAILLENVPNLVSMDKGRIKDKIISDFKGLGYEITYKVLLASDYGVPQNRKRVFFVGLLQNNKEFLFPTPGTACRKVTCAEAMSDLPEKTVECGNINQFKAKSAYQQFMRKNTNNIYNHEITKHTDKTIETISLVPDGGNYKNLPEHLQQTRKVNIAWTRYCSTKPSFTIDTGHRHHFHYKWNRVPTVRESARLQSFPDDFIFYGSKTSQYKQVGNAVPPLLAQKLAEQLLISLKE